MPYIKQIIKKIKSKIPISRGRYERELSLLRLSVSKSVDMERRHLSEMIDKIGYASIENSSFSSDGMRRIVVSMNIGDRLNYFNRDQSFKRALVYEMSKKLEMELDDQLNARISSGALDECRAI
jgi:hypothetical protein